MTYRVRPPRHVSRRALLAPGNYVHQQNESRQNESLQIPVLYPLSGPGDLPPGVALQPLPDPKKAERDKAIKILVGLVLVVVFLMWLDNRNKREMEENSRERSRPSKRSTAQMAKDLYDRLDKRGDVNENVMRSLAQLSRNA